jgi:hypothetical protein
LIGCLLAGNYGEGDEEQGASSRITTNESGIRIVESSTILEPEAEDDVEYNQYEDYGGRWLKELFEEYRN